MRNLLSILLGLLVIASCQSNKGDSIQPPIDLNDGITVAAIDEQEVDEELLDELNKDIFEGMYGNIHSLLIMKDNDLIVEQYYRDGNQDEIKRYDEIRTTSSEWR